MSHQSFAKLALIGLAAGMLSPGEEAEARAPAKRCFLQAAQSGCLAANMEHAFSRSPSESMKNSFNTQHVKDETLSPLATLLGYSPKHQCAHHMQ